MPSLDEYIAALVAIRNEYGGALPVEKWMPAKARHSAPLPKLAHQRMFPRKGGSAEAGPAFYNPEFDNLAQKGDPVVRV